MGRVRCICGILYYPWVDTDGSYEPCNSCMNPAIPDPVWYNMGDGDDPGWDEPRWPNEY